MQTISVQTAQNVTIYYEAATVGDRIAAYFIDSLIAIGLFISLIIVDLTMPKNYFLSLLLTILFWLVWVLSNLIQEIFLNGQTIGKRIRKIKVIRVDGTQANLGDYLMRWFLTLVDNLFFGIIAIITISVNNRGQRLGDIAAGTTVIKLQAQIKLSDLMNYHHLNENYYNPQFTQVILLSEKDMRIIKEAVQKYNLTNNGKLIDATAAKVKSLLKIQNSAPPLIFLRTIIKDYNYLTNESEKKIYQ